MLKLIKILSKSLNFIIIVIIVLFLSIPIPVLSATESYEYPITITMLLEWFEKGLIQPIPKPATYYIQNIPSETPHITTDIVDGAFDEWITLNPELKFTRVYSENEADIVIQWVKELKLDGENVGGINELFFESDGYVDYKSSIIKIDVADIDCNHRIIYRDDATIQNILKHEIGHWFGLEHSNNPKHLMFDPVDGVYDFDDLGYEIPDSIEYDNFLGMNELEEKYDKVEDDFYKHLKRYKVTKFEWDNTPEGFINEHLVKFGNQYVDEMNDLANQINCYSEGVYDWYVVEDLGNGMTATIIPSPPPKITRIDP